MKKLCVLFVFVFSLFAGFAQMNNDRAIANILRDSNYLSADVRASSEDEARGEAFTDLYEQVVDYSRRNNLQVPATIQDVSGKFQTLTSQISSNRIRVLAYINKADLNGAGASPSAQTHDYNPDVSVSTVAISDDLPTPLRELANISDGTKVASRLQQLRTDGKIKGAAAFPIANFGDFYVILINPLNDVETILHFDGMEWTDVVNSNKKVNPENYKNYKAFWVTL